MNSKRAPGLTIVPSIRRAGTWMFAPSPLDGPGVNRVFQRPSSVMPSGTSGGSVGFGFGVGAGVGVGLGVAVGVGVWDGVGLGVGGGAGIDGTAGVGMTAIAVAAGADGVGVAGSGVAGVGSPAHATTISARRIAARRRAIVFMYAAPAPKDVTQSARYETTGPRLA